MMIALVSVLLMTTTPANDAGPAKRSVLVLDLEAQGVDVDVARTLTANVAAGFARESALTVTSGADLRSLIDLHATKAATGCSDESCLNELAGALGAELVVSGSVGKLGSMLVVHVSLYDAKATTS